MAIPARRDGETGWTLGKPVPRFTQIPLGEAGGQFGAPIGPSADQPESTGWWTEPELAEAPPEVEEPCISLLARAKSGKVQLVWSQLPEVQLYEIYRAADAESIVFERIGEADGNGWTYLDDNLPNELTYLYLVRALAPDWSCDSEVSSAHPTAARRPANYPPVIYSQPPSQGLAGTHYFYLIQATDPNPEDVVVYGLLTGPPGMTVDPQTGWLRWLAEAGRQIVTVAAADGRGGIDLQMFSIDIFESNSAPVAQAGPDQTVFVGQTVILDGSGSSDADGDPLTFFWSFASLPPVSAAFLSDPTAVNPTFVVDQPGAYTVQLIVHDGFVDSAADTVTISTDNSAPVAQAGPDQTVFVGQTVTLDGSGSSDADGDPLTFFWSFTSVPSGSAAVLSDPTAVNPTFLVDQPGAYTVQLIVNDGCVDGAPDTVTISTLNSKPVANAGPDQSVESGSTVNLDGSGSSDADNDTLTYQWALLSKPAGSTATLSDPTAAAPSFVADLAGDYVAQLIVNDGTVDSTPGYGLHHHHAQDGQHSRRRGPDSGCR